MFVPPGADLRATDRLSKLRRHCRGFREEPSESKWLGCKTALSPLSTLREQFCKGFTDRKRCANGTFFGRNSIHPAKLAVVNQITTAKSRAQARRICGFTVQLPIICILLLCYFPIALYLYGAMVRLWLFLIPKLSSEPQYLPPPMPCHQTCTPSSAAPLHPALRT